MPPKFRPVRLIFALVLAPLLATLLINLIPFVFILPDALENDGAIRLAFFLASALFIATKATFVAFWTLGTLYHAIASEAGWRTIHHYACAGMLLGGVTGLFLAPTPSPDSRMIAMAYGCVLGTTIAAIFWLIRRPDRDQAPSP